jgi:hypothetical protein
VDSFIGNFILFIAIIWLLGWVVRQLFRYWLARKVNQFNRAAGGGFGSANGNRGFGNRRENGAGHARKEGDVTVDGTSATASKKVRKDVGEYVDFEEVEDEK